MWLSHQEYLDSPWTGNPPSISELPGLAQKHLSIIYVNPLALQTRQGKVKVTTLGLWLAFSNQDTTLPLVLSSSEMLQYAIL